MYECMKWLHLDMIRIQNEGEKKEISKKAPKLKRLKAQNSRKGIKREEVKVARMSIIREKEEKKRRRE